MSNLASLPDASHNKGWVIVSIEDVCESLEPVIGKMNCIKLTQHLYALFCLICDKIELLKQGHSSTAEYPLDMSVIVCLSDFLNTQFPIGTPEGWYADVLMLFQLQLNAVTARLAEEWDMEAAYNRRILSQFKRISGKIVKSITARLEK